MPIYRKGKRKWRIRIWHKGVRQDWVVKGSKDDAEAFEARKRTELEAGSPHEMRAAPKFSDFCATRYRPHAEAHLKASTWSARTYQLATLIQHFGELRLTEITPEAIDHYKQRRVKQVKAVSVNNELAVLQAVLTFAREMRFPTAQPKIKFFKVRGAHKVKAWSAVEVARLYKVITKKCVDILPLVVFLMNTGCRKGEALALTWDNVDLERGIIRIWPSEEWQPKDNDPREVPISDALLPWLKVEHRSKKWVFPTPRTGERYACWPKRFFDAARKAAGLTGGPHTCRHTFASHFLAKVPDLYLLAKILGHSDARVTRLYAHLLPDHLARGRNAVSLAASIGPEAIQKKKEERERKRAKRTARAHRSSQTGKTVPKTVPTQETANP